MSEGQFWLVCLAFCAVAPVILALRLREFVGPLMPPGRLPLYTAFAVDVLLAATAGYFLTVSPPADLAVTSVWYTVGSVWVGLVIAYGLGREVRLMPTRTALRGAKLAFDAGRPAEAEATYRRVLASGRLRRKASQANLWYNIAFAAFQQGHEAGSVEAATRATTLHPRRALFWGLLAVSAARAGRDEEARAACNRAALLRPRFAPIWANVAYALELLGRHQDAIDASTTALSHLGPGALVSGDPATSAAVRASTLATRAMAFNALGRYYEALADAEAALGVAPSAQQPQGHRQAIRGATARAVALAGLQQVDDARAVADAALAMADEGIAQPANAFDAWRARVVLLSLLGRPQEAAQAEAARPR